MSIDKIKNGILALNKESGLTSFDYIYKLKKLLNVKKAGHTGTLDKEATGVLVCLIDEATSFQEALMKNGKKIYKAELVLGISTDTEDIFGNVIDIEDISKIKNIEKDKIENSIKSFVGEYNQVPPMISSKKINGKKLMYYAKKNIEVERSANLVHIDYIKILDEEYKNILVKYNDDKKEFKVRVLNIEVSCSKGTYIRTLCKDIGDKLKLPSCMGNLCRTYTSGYDIKDALTIDEIKNKIDNDDFSFIRPVYKVSAPQVVTFGKFELLHVGHKKIIDEVVRLAKVNNIESTCLLVNNNDIKSKEEKDEIMTYEQRLSRLDLWGIDNIFNLYLDKASKNLSKEDFVDKILVEDLMAKYVVVGSDCSFGKNAEGHAEFLINRLKNYNIEVIVMDKLKVKDLGFDDDTYISSTYIKKLLSDNEDGKNTEKALKMLGRKLKNSD